MQLTAWAVAAVGLVAAMTSSAHGDRVPLDAATGARATMRFYADDDHVTVYSPGVDATVVLTPRTAIDLDVAADVVSGASVDVLTSASPGPMSERRLEAGATLTHAFDVGVATRGSATARASHERDYDAVRVGGSVRTELAARNVTVEARYVGGLDQAGDATDATFHRSRSSHELIVVVSQLLSPRTIASVVVDGTRAVGYHASPYRTVWIHHPTWPVPMRVDEATPRVRTALAAALRLRHATGGGWFATVDARGYRDDWSIDSATLTAEVRRAIDRRWLVGAAASGYAQGGAAFHRGTYVSEAGPPTLRTADRTLGPMRGAFATGTVDVAFGEDERWHLVSAAGVHAWWFLDSPAQARRRAVVVTTSLAVPW